MKELRSLIKLLDKYEVKGATYTENGEYVIVEYNGKKVMLKSSGVISVDTLVERFGVSQIFNLPVHQYLLLEWMHDNGLHNKKFKYVASYPSCELCWEQRKVQAGIPACAMITTSEGAKYVCPEHSVNQEVLRVLVGG